jgi:hypothetical protein
VYFNRAHRTKNSRLLAELREIDSYDTDSDDENEILGGSLRQEEFDNSILKAGRSLLQAAESNPLEALSSTGNIEKKVPKVTLCLTRLDPALAGDPRVQQTVELLEEMGLTVQLGERVFQEPNLVSLASTAPVANSATLHSTLNINLDLSLLIALVSDLTHATLPKSVAEAEARFSRIQPATRRDTPSVDLRGSPQNEVGLQDTDADPEDVNKHSRALINQLLQEIGKSMLQEMSERLASAVPGPGKIQFWTTPEAKERCLRIVEKIGGEREKRRAKCLFASADHADNFWQGSRFPNQFIPLLPIQLYPFNVPNRASITAEHGIDALVRDDSFFFVLEDTCTAILATEQSNDVNEDAGRAAPMKANSRLTAHTVRSLLWGARLGWTTLTANRTSVKAIVREIGARSASLADVSDSRPAGTTAAIWVVDPRSLAEEMRKDL